MFEDDLLCLSISHISGAASDGSGALGSGRLILYSLSHNEENRFQLLF